MKIRDTTVAQFETRFTLGGYYFGTRWCPAVDTRDGGYLIRILRSERHRGADTTTTYDYFQLDETGLVLTSPRGNAAEYNRKVRVTDIAEAVERFATPMPVTR